MDDTDAKIELETPAPEAAARELHERLVEAGQALSEADMPTFLLAVRDTAGRMTAGCKGEIAFRSAHISELWVDAAHRGEGLGRRLLARAEAHARAKKCMRVHLETRSARARALYERLGYRVFGELPEYDGGVPFWYLEKRLD